MGAANGRGFTLLELLVTLAVAVVLLTIAVPSYRSMITRNSLAANVNDLVGALNYARTEAAGRGTTVYICSSVDQENCRTNNPDVWSDGWVVYAPDPDTTTTTPNDNNRLRVHGPTGSGFELTANRDEALSFNADGFANNFRSFTGETEDGQTTVINVATTGRIRSDTSP